MKIKNKFLKLIYFIKAFNSFKDSDTLVDVNEANYNVLKDFAQTTGITFDNYNNSFQEILDKYDYDCDGVISIIDTNLPNNILVHHVTSDDPKYNAANCTYNGKSLDLTNSGSVNIGDQVRILEIVSDLIKSHFGVSYTIDYNDLTNEIAVYYKNHNYRWPTLKQLAYYKSKNMWEPKIKVTSAEDFIATNYVETGITIRDFGWYQNASSRLGIPACTSANPSIMFDDFYWKNNYVTTNATYNGIQYVSYDQWTTRGVGFKNLIIDSSVVVLFGRHQWDTGYWNQTTLYVNDALVNDYTSVYQNASQMPLAIKPLSEYNTDHSANADWWTTY